MGKVLLVFSFLIYSVSGKSQITFTNSTGGAIPDNGPQVYFPIVVNDPLLDSLTSAYGLESVTLNITHPNDGDVVAQLVSPDGTTINLFQNVGVGGQNFTNTVFNDTSSVSISLVIAPFTGIYHSFGNLHTLNDGNPGNGTWYLVLQDVSPLDSGSLNNVKLTFSNHPAPSPPPFTSNLPIIKLYTDSNSVIGDSTLGSWMDVIDNGPGQRNALADTMYKLRSRIGINIRGFSSAGFPKKQYGFQTYDINNNVVDTVWLGFPTGSDWILQGEYADKTLMRNNLSYDLSRDMGHYASRVRYVEVFINDQYNGVYIGLEKIERDPNRVNISKLKTTDTAGSQLTGGYILKFDHITGGGGWYSQISVTNSGGSIYPFFQYYYPSDTKIKPQQAAYIQNFMDSFEAALNGPQYQDSIVGFRHFIKENTFIDYEIITEMCKDIDGYRLSTYFYKEKDTHGGKLNMGPAWDYDLAWDNANYCAADIDTGWNYDYNYVCTPEVPFWWERLMTDTTYTRRLYCRYNSLRTQGFLRFDSLFHYIDTTVALLNESEQRNFDTWPELGVATWPEPSPIPLSYAGEVQNLKNWLTNRLTWLDSAMLPFATAYPSVSAGHDTTLCRGQSVVLSSGAQYQSVWSTGDSTTAITVSQPGIYTVTASSYYGCPSSASVRVQVQPLPSASFSQVSPVSNTYTFSPQDTTQANYYWTFGDGSSSTSASPTHQYVSPGTYIITLQVSDHTGCESVSTDTVSVSPLGINNVATATVRIYPNPASEIVYMETPAAGGMLTVTNSIGQRVLSQNLSGCLTALSVSGLASGIYILTVTGQQYTYNIKWSKE